MGCMGSVEMFERFSRGDFVRQPEKLDGQTLWLMPDERDIGGGRMKLREIDRIRDYPEANILCVSGLDQECFDYLIQTYGKQFTILQFFKNKLVEDWSALGTLPRLEYLYFFFNQRIEKFWDMSANDSLKGISILDFSRLKTVAGIERAKNLEFFCMGNAVWDKSEIDTYAPFAGTNVRYLSFWGKRILDTDPAYLVAMKKLEVLQGVTSRMTREQVAWVKANAVNPLALGPRVISWTDRETGEPDDLVQFPWKGQRSYHLQGNEQRLDRDRGSFQALVDRYRGVSYEEAFGKRQV